MSYKKEKRKRKKKQDPLLKEKIKKKKIRLFKTAVPKFLLTQKITVPND